MGKLKIKLLASQGTPAIVYEEGVRRIEKLFFQGCYELVEENPDVLFFLTGGTEHAAIHQVSFGNYYVLIGSRHANAYASATEVKAYLNDQNIKSLLIDEEDPETPLFLKNLFAVKQACIALKGKRLGLIGQVSDWLIASSISADLLKSKMGIELISIAWNELSHFSEFKPSDSFLNSFSGVKSFDLIDTARVSELLTDTIKKWNLDAITVECFPLVLKDSVTACLPLARFNDNGIPAGCEGDLAAITGMMVGKELTGIVPWMANINKVSEGVCVFSHCTIAPGLVADFSVKTHFETGKGTAVDGAFKSTLVTIFRFDNKLRKAFIALAVVTGRPKLATACRTQIEVKLTSREAELLKNNPLGNHHLVIPGDCKKLLELFCSIQSIDVLE